MPQSSPPPVPISATGPQQVLQGSSADDILVADYEYVTLVGNGGTDEFRGTGGHLMVMGGDGDDSVDLPSGIGFNIVAAGAGTNVVHVLGIGNWVTSGDGNDTVTGTTGSSTFSVGGGTNNVTAGGGGNIITAGDGINTIFASLAGDSIVGGNTVTLGSGTNLVSVLGEHNAVSAGDGTNTVTANGGQSTFSVGAGRSQLSLVGDNDDVVAGIGQNTIGLTGSFATIRSDGTSTVAVAGNYDFVQTGSGGDSVSVDGQFATVHTGDGADKVSSTGGYLTAELGSGDDTVSLVLGNNFVDGGTGRDTAIYTLSAANVTLARTADGIWTVTDADGHSDTLVGVEVAHFADRDVALSPNDSTLVLLGTHDQYSVAQTAAGSPIVVDRIDGRDGVQQPSGLRDLLFADGAGRYDATGNAGRVARLYQAALGRVADLAGLDHWTAQVDAGTAAFGEVAASFAASTEFYAKYGQLDDRGFVQLLYTNALGRTGEDEGVGFWTNALTQGATRAQILVAFSECQENKNNTAANIGDRGSAQAYRLYQAAFDRTPDLPGLSYWGGVLGGGAAPLTVAESFAMSAEFLAAYGGLGNDSFVSKLYDNALHRPAEAEGLQFWAGQLDGGASRASLLLAFADSTESRLGTAAATHDAWVFLG